MVVTQPTRRGFLLGMLAAPVIIKASSLMAVKPVYASGGVVGVRGYDAYGRSLYEEYHQAIADLNEARLKVQMHTLERRLAIGGSPRLLVVPPGLMSQARRIIGS